ncbi:MAG: hypothetical protein ACOXZS_04355 [Bacilli bacterium]
MFWKKKRYVNPLCSIDDEVDRITNLSSKAKELLDQYLDFKDSPYAYINCK